VSDLPPLSRSLQDKLLEMQYRSLVDMTTADWLAEGAPDRRAAAAQAYPLFLENVRLCPFATKAIDAGEDPAHAVARAMPFCCRFCQPAQT
jgi:hypothetical protein